MDIQTEISIFIWLGLATMACLTFAVILFFITHRKKVLEKEAKMQVMEKEKQFEIFKSASYAEDKQKEKIGQNMHDEIIPVLSAVERSLGTNINEFGTDNFDLNRLIRDHNFIGNVISNIRGISHDLASKTLQTVGLIEAIREHVNLLNGIENNETVFESTMPANFQLPFSAEDQATIYRVCLELINNLFKHANPPAMDQGYNFYLKVIVELESSNFIIALMHNGKGITNGEIETLEQRTGGLGLKSLKSRVLMLKGKIDYAILPEFSVITFAIPIIN